MIIVLNMLYQPLKDKKEGHETYLLLLEHFKNEIGYTKFRKENLYKNNIEIPNKISSSHFHNTNYDIIYNENKTVKKKKTKENKVESKLPIFSFEYKFSITDDLNVKDMFESFKKQNTTLKFSDITFKNG